MSATSGIPARSASEGVRFSIAGSALRLWMMFPLLIVAGCRSQPYVNAHIESVNTEYRQLEDYVYALEDENSRLQQELESLRTVTTPGRTPAAVVPSTRGGLFRRPPASPPPRRSPALESTPESDAPVIEVPGSSPPAPSRGGRSTLQRPATNSLERSLPADTPPSVEFHPTTPPNETPTTDDILPIPGESRGEPASAPERIPARPTDKKITHLFLNPLQTGAADFDGQPGDDGLRVVIEPRNASDQFVPEAGVLSVVLLDPDRQGEAARVARWDFDQSATRQLLADSGSARGIKLEVPWPASAPDATRLKLFVRYEAPDGRRLQADREVFVTAPGQVVSRWTPRSADRQRPTELVTAIDENASSPPPIRSASSGASPGWSPNR